MIYEGGSHFRMQTLRAWAEAIHRDSVDSDPEGQDERRREANSTHNV
jgi:hypothetical protein